MTATNLTRKTLLIDGTNILVRAAYAARGKHLVLSNRDGVPTAALLIFINLLSRYIKAERPDNLVVCWDGGRSTLRTAIWSGYKAQRDIAPEDDPERPVAQAKEFCTLAGLHHSEMPGVEADDLVAAHWRGKHSSERVVILSGDKDFLQLLDGWTEQIRPGVGLDERWTRNRVRTEFQCLPEQLPMVMALSGDLVDGIPGVPRFGTKTAVKVLAKYAFDLDRAIEVEPKLAGQEAVVRRNLSLVNLRDPITLGGSTAFYAQVPPAPKFTPTSVTSVVWPDLERFLMGYDLHSVRDRLIAGSLWAEASLRVALGQD